MIKKIVFLIISFILIRLTAVSQTAIDTVWSGYIGLTSSKLKIVVRINSENNVLKANIDIPEQNATKLELVNVSFDNPKVHFELESPLGQAIFDGLYYSDSISGTFEQASFKGKFSLFKDWREAEDTLKEENLLYNAEEVSFTNDSIIFAGTLTYPKTEGKHPAVILISGSGPQNRDENIFGFKIFKIIAEHLSKNGIAVLRFDDRGVGKTNGKTVNESTTADFAGDVIAAVKYLKTRDNINPGQIGLMGHSEGGVVAPLAASNSDDIAFIVLMAGTGVSGADIITGQSSLILKADKSTDEEIENYIKMLNSVIDAIKNNKSLDAVKEQIRNDIIDNFDKIPEKQRKEIKDKEKYAAEAAEQTIATFNSVWMKYFVLYDPAPALAKIKCPVLVLFGELDLQVAPEQNRKPIIDALKKGGNKDYKVIIFPKANHLFQLSETGSPTEYASLPKEFVPGFLDAVSGWILQRVTVVK